VREQEMEDRAQNYTANVANGTESSNEANQAN